MEIQTHATFRERVHTYAHGTYVTAVVQATCGGATCAPAAAAAAAAAPGTGTRAAAAGSYKEK